MRAPTRLTSTLGFSEAVWASAAAANRAPARILANPLFLNRCMFLGIAHHLSAGILHFDFARDQADEGASNQHQPADPDPRNQRKDERLNYGPLVILPHRPHEELFLNLRGMSHDNQQ